MANKPSRVSLTGTIASENTVIGPMTGQRAALFLLSVGARVIIEEIDSEGRSYTREAFEERARMIVGESVLLQTELGSILVPAGDLELVFPHTDASDGSTVAVDRPLPDELSSQLDPSEDAVLFYRELALSRGERVQLKGFIAQRKGRDASDSAEGQWVARPDLGPMKLIDRSQSDVDVARIKGTSQQQLGFLLTIIVCAVGVGYYLWTKRASTQQEPAPPSGRQATMLRDTEGRSFEDTCSPDPSCTLRQTGGPVDAARPRIFLRQTDYLVSVCTAEINYRSDGQGWTSAGEERDCRPLACISRPDCPVGKHIACVNGLCAQPSKQVGIFDVYPLCLAGKGIDAQNPDVDAAGLRTPCRPADCQLPASCRKP